jgi:kynureninase
MTLRDPLLRWRKEFPILSRCRYLISNSLGAMPRAVFSRLESYAELWATKGVRAWSDAWWEMSVTTGDTLAPLIGAKAGELSMHTNISTITAMLVSAFDFSRKRNVVVLNELEFPSVRYVYEQLATALGAKIRVVTSPDGITIPADRLLRAIDDTTMLVPISHVLFKSAYIMDVAAVVGHAHRHGARVVLDAYHSVGTMPVDVRHLGVDALLGGVLKWLCGGPGAAFLWVRPSLRQTLRPRATGWMAHRRPFAFDAHMSYAQGPARFLNGTPAIPSLYAATEGARIITRAGIGRVREKSVRQTGLIAERAKAYGYRLMSPEDPLCRGGTVSIAVPHAYQVSRELLRRKIIVDYREGSGIRIAPHFYSTDEEVVAAVDEIRTILDTKAYRRHRASRSTVT